MCGLVGIVSNSPVNQAIYDALTVLQHRGQDAAGIAIDDGGTLRTRKSKGLVRDVFHTRHMMRLRGNVGIGHVRYPTAGWSSSAEAQPFYVNSPYGLCLAHNGNLTNAEELKTLLVTQDRRHLNTGSDTEALLNVFADELQHQNGNGLTPDAVFAAVAGVHRRCKGGYAVIVMIIGYGLVAFRDLHRLGCLEIRQRSGARCCQPPDLGITAGEGAGHDLAVGASCLSEDEQRKVANLCGQGCGYRVVEELTEPLERGGRRCQSQVTPWVGSIPAQQGLEPTERAQSL